MTSWYVRKLKWFSQTLALMVCLASLLFPGIANASGEDDPIGNHNAKTPQNLNSRPSPRITVGGDHSFPPFDYLDENGKPAGFNSAVTKALGRQVGLTVDIRLGSWTKRLEELSHGRIDAIQGMFYSPGRDRAFDFSAPYTVIHYVAVTRKGTGRPPATLAELAGKTIVVQTGDIMHDFLLENGLGKETAVAPTMEAALRELAEGRYDCALVARLTASYLIKKHGWTNLVIGRQPFISPEYCYAFHPGSEALLAQFNEGLKILKDSGEYRRIYNQHLGIYEDPSPGFTALFRFILLLAVPLLILLLIGFIWVWSLRREVARRTAALETEAFRRKILLDNSLDGIFALNTNGRVFEANQRFAKMLGYSVEEIRQTHVWHWDTVWTRERVLDGIKNHNEPLMFFETILRRKDGSCFEVEISANHVVVDGEVMVFGICRDITDRKQTEQSLREEEVRRHLLLEKSRDGIVIMDGNCKVFEANQRFAEMLGYSFEEVHQLHVWDWDVQWSREQLLEIARTIEANGRLFETRHRRKDGTCFDVEISSNEAFIQGQKLVLCICRDISERKQAEQALRDSEEKYRLLAENASDVIWTYSLIEDRYTYISPSIEKMFGYTVAEAMQISLKDHLPSEALSRVLQTHSDVMANTPERQPESFFEMEQIRKNGTFLWTEVAISVVRDSAGDPIAFQGITRDITERKLAVADLNMSYQAMEACNNGIMVCDALNPNHPICYVNPAFEKITGFKKDEVLGLNPGFLADNERNRSGFLEMSRALKNQVEVAIEIHNHRQDGSQSWKQLKIAPVRISNGDVTHFVGIIDDITERKKHVQELEHKATHDSLTGLANRSLLEDRINQSIFYAGRSKRIVAVLLLDLDRFKRINDTFGHSWGDLLIKEVAQRLSKTIRECDTVARFGGDEFVIVLAEIADISDIGKVNKKILEALSQPFRINNHELEISTSIGISFYPENGRRAESLIQKADLAMFQAKQAGGNTSRYFSPEMTARAREMLSLEAGMREALKKEEFLLYYQPKINLKSGQIVGCEALVRWQHPQKGLLTPSHFIPAAEETGLILPMGQWILETACRQAKNWELSASPAFGISVNVSARQFRQEDFVEQICRILEKTGVKPEMISLEITESMVVEDIPNAVKVMEQLKSLGLGLHLDDFGTGFSNFNSLRQFKVDCLKIDHSFIADCLSEPSAAAVVQSIIAIAHNLGLSAVAEGVETREQLDFLLECNCDEFQGYLFSHPLPAEEFITLLSPGETRRTVSN